MIKIINHLPPPYDEFEKKNNNQRNVAIGLSLFIIISIFLLYVFAYQKKAPADNVEIKESNIKKAEVLPKVDEKSDSEVKIITEEIKPGDANKDDRTTDETDKNEEVEINDTLSDNTSSEDSDYTDEKIPKDAFLFPSDSVLITDEKLESLDDKTIELIKNEIYARHGYIFTDRALKKYFETFSWYKPNDDYSPKLLNQTEKANIKIIKKFQSREK